MSADGLHTVSYLGPAASYSHQAVRLRFPEKTWKHQPVVTIDDVFDHVQDGLTEAGVVPFENSTNGSVVFTLDNLADRAHRYKDVTVVGEVYVDVHHCLVGHRNPSSAAATTLAEEAGDNSGVRTPTAANPSPREPRSKPSHSVSHVKRLYSHPQAFGQCHDFISAYLKGVEVFEVSSTSKAAEIVSQDETGTWAAISSGLAAEVHHLTTLVTAIEDREDNTTRFLIIAKCSSIPADWGLLGGRAKEPGNKSLVSVTVPHQSPGALADVLSSFKTYHLNMTSINTRPSLKAPFQYIFFIEFAGHRFQDEDEAVEGALKRISERAESWRWLGSWQSYR